MSESGIQSQDVGIQPEVKPAVTASQVQEATEHKPVERTFRQSELNEIVKRAKHDAVESFRKQQTEQPQYVQQKYGEQPSYGLSQDEIRKMASEEAQRLRDQWVQEATQKQQEAEVQRIVQDFTAKISSGRERFPDFEAVTGELEMHQFPNVVQMLARDVDNADAILYEFGKNPEKMVQVELAAERSFQAGRKAIQKLAQSIKDNQEAEKAAVPKSPLSQLRPSNAGTDNGAMSVKDLRNKYRA